jgi:hypothetical protein
MSALSSYIQSLQLPAAGEIFYMDKSINILKEHFGAKGFQIVESGASYMITGNFNTLNDMVFSESRELCDALRHARGTVLSTIDHSIICAGLPYPIDYTDASTYPAILDTSIPIRITPRIQGHLITLYHHNAYGWTVASSTQINATNEDIALVIPYQIEAGFTMERLTHISLTNLLCEALKLRDGTTHVTYLDMYPTIRALNKDCCYHLMVNIEQGNKVHIIHLSTFSKSTQQYTPERIPTFAKTLEDSYDSIPQLKSSLAQSAADIQAVLVFIGDDATPSFQINRK